MEKYVLTISRQFGSMGRSIAKELSQELGIAFYDRDIVEETAKRLNLPVSRISSTEEKAVSGWLYRKFPLGTDESYMQDIIFESQKEIMLDFMSRSSCIIVGRCADSLAAGMKNHINIYVYAPVEKRIENCISQLGMEEKQARRMAAGVDRARRAYHKKYAGYLPNDDKYMDLMINSSLLGVKGTVNLLSDMVKKWLPETQNRVGIKDENYR